MKILYLVQFLAPYRTDWMNELSKENEVHAYVMFKGAKTRTAEWLNSREKKFKTHKLRSFKFMGTYFSMGLKKILKQNEFDIYLIDGYASPIEYSALKYLTKRGKHVFVNVDGIDIWRNRGLIGKFKSYIKRKIYRMPVNFLCGSNIAADFMVKNGADRDRIHKHCFSSIKDADIITFEQKVKQQKLFKEQNGLAGKKIVVAAGRFIPLKRYEDLIRAFKYMPQDCVLYLIGGGELKEKYQRIIEEENIKNVNLIDFILDNKLYQYYIGADLFVHTTSTDTWGLVINEAMAKGCPIISSNRCVAGMELVSDGKNGYVFSVGDIEDLKDKMLKVLTDDDLRLKMMENALEDIKPYTVENLGKTHNEIFKKSYKED